MIVHNANYRLNPSRAIYVEGEFTEALLSKLTPSIIGLQAQSREPISVYIVNSPGGRVDVMQNMLRLLRLPDQDAATPCRLITVVTTRAASAAADLLSAGDYAIAFPDSAVLYHGVRTSGLGLQPLTAQNTSLLAHILRLTNDAFAMDLARKAERRFLLRFVTLRHGFEKLRAEHKKLKMSELDCFVALMTPLLSTNGGRVLKSAQERYVKYEPLLAKLTTPSQSRSRGPERLARLEARRIKAIADFLLSRNREDAHWSFKDGGMSRLVDDFYLMTEYFEYQESDRLERWCTSLGQFHLSESEKTELAAITDEKERNAALVQKVRPPMRSLWMFFVALCHALQEDDHDLTAKDAYWLGLIDEVLGDKDLLTSRWFEEYKDDPKPENKEEQIPAPTETKGTAGA